jgi:hypothetical protein
MDLKENVSYEGEKPRKDVKRVQKIREKVRYRYPGREGCGSNA